MGDGFREAYKQLNKIVCEELSAEDIELLRKERQELEKTYRLSDSSTENKLKGERIREIDSLLRNAGVYRPQKQDRRKDRRPPVVRTR